MAAPQSSPLCPPLGLLLLLIGLISSRLLEVQARPTDFWCNSAARKSMEERIDGLKEDMASCSDPLPSAVQLPCVWVNPTEWENKTVQQKCVEVAGALQVFRDGVEGARNQTTLPCQTSLLEKLEHHITNYLAIFSRLQTQNDTVVQNCSSSQTSLNKVLDQYTRLLKGKMKRLATDLEISICKEEQRTTNTHRH